MLVFENIDPSLFSIRARHIRHPCFFQEPIETHPHWFRTRIRHSLNKVNVTTFPSDL